MSPHSATLAKRSTRRTYKSQKILTCSGCHGEITPGTKFWRGLTKEPWHPECRRTGVVPRPTPARRYLCDNPIGQPCGGCGLEIRANDVIVHKSAVPWHRFCLLGR